MPKIDYQKELNSCQLEAVRSTEGPYLVIAGAGSGKTRTLTYRVAYLVEQGVRPEEILLLTFTRRAAQEMLFRASELLDARCARISGGTFHSFANLILRKYAHFLGIRSYFTILDQADAEDAISQAKIRIGLDKTDKRFPKKNALLAVISKSVNKCLDLERVLYEDYPNFLEWAPQLRKIRDEYALYKHINSLLDYDDLLVYLKKILLDYEDIRKKLSTQYRYIMVDEYQDTNKIQADIIYNLACVNKNIMAVGDDSQSIYSFRGANFKNIIDFPKAFPGAGIITLEENYRSTQPILNLTNEIIRQAEVKFNKKLWTRRVGSGFPSYVEAQDENAQSKYIVNKIINLKKQGVRLKDIAVLFRSGWHSNDLEVELSSCGVPFVKYGGLKFTEGSHVKDILAYLRIAHNCGDYISWQRVLLLMDGVGGKTCERIIKELRENKENILNNPESSIKKAKGLKALLGLIQKSQGLKNKPAELMRIFLEFYQPYLRAKYEDFDKRVNDLDSLKAIAFRYDSLEHFLVDMTLDPQEKNVIENGPDWHKGDYLNLSTIHSAKGLEWHTVFLIHVADGYLPSYLSLEDDERIEEERRLFYVALTRAKEKLFLLRPMVDYSAKSYFSMKSGGYTRLSRFLEELDGLDKLIDASVC